MLNYTNTAVTLLNILNIEALNCTNMVVIELILFISRYLIVQIW